MRPLGDGVHVWRVPFDAALALRRLEKALTPGEVERAARYHFERDRLRFASARGALREVLAEYLGCAPLLVPLRTAQGGKPELDTGELSFNLSHSGDLALIAVRRAGLLGVDVEWMRPVEWLRLSERFFSVPEQGAVVDLPSFFRIWTRKEACLKATGRGLTVPLDSFDATQDRVHSEFLGELFVQELKVGANYAVALAGSAPLVTTDILDWA